MAFYSELSPNLLIKSWSFFNVPLLFFVGPEVVALDDEKCIVKVPLNWRTRNHLKSMYFAALSAGADCAGGLAAMREIQTRKLPVSLVFKEFKAQFLKRAEGDVIFTNQDVAAVRALVNQAISSQERVEAPVRVVATVPTLLPDSEPVARFELLLSLKKNSSNKS